MNIEDIYTPIDEAKKELQRRWNDKELQKKVEDFLNGDIPDFLLDSPKAYLARHLSSPNFEFLRFKELANDIGLDFILSECLDDRYISINIHKRHLGKMFFYSGIDKNGKKFFSPQKIVDFNTCDNKNIRNINTISGETLVDFHHNLLFQEFPNLKNKVKDISDWLKRNGKNAHNFYLNFLALFLRNGVLFESFLLNEEEKKLTEQVVIPAISTLKEKFGIKPLIVRLLPKDTEQDSFWHYYNKFLKNYSHDNDGNNC